MLVPQTLPGPKKFIDTTGPVRLVGRWRWLTGMCGFAFLLVSAVVLVLGLPYGYRLLTQTCLKDCNLTGQLTAANLKDLQKIGISIDSYTIFYIVVFVIFTIICFGVGSLILWKKPGELLPLCAAVMILSLPTVEGQLVFFSDFFKDYPYLEFIFNVVSIPGNLILAYLFLSFPNGRFKGKIFWWLFVALGIGPSLTYFYLVGFGIEFSVDPATLSLPASLPLTFLVLLISFIQGKDFSIGQVVKYLGYMLVCFLAILVNVYVTGFLALLAALIYRYYKVLNPRERYSTKWLIYGFSIFLLLYMVFVGIVPSITELHVPGSYFFIIDNFLRYFGCGFSLVGSIMSVLYANAFDINLVIKRTIVYTILSLLVAGIYIGSIIGLQALVRTISGQESDLAIVGATLISLVLFQPLRKAIQNFVNRRFYRSKYDAIQTIAELNDKLRTEMDLKTLSLSLRGVLNETLQPEQVTIWFKKRSQNSRS